MSVRSLRACMLCSVVRTQAQFNREGCPNCEEFLELRNNLDGIQDCTSSVFEGLITLSDPENSWVAKWQRLQGYVPGTYAVKVVGIVSAGLPAGCRLRWGLTRQQLPDDYIAAAENAGTKYIP